MAKPVIIPSNHDFTRTDAAIKLYDQEDAILDAMGPDTPVGQLVAQFDYVDLLGEHVGEAFGLDTADINNLDTCRGCIRPGRKIPSPGREPSFVRRMVLDWKKHKENS